MPVCVCEEVNTVGEVSQASLEYIMGALSAAQQDQPTRWGSRCSVHWLVPTHSAGSLMRRPSHQTPLRNVDIKYDLTDQQIHPHPDEV